MIKILLSAALFFSNLFAATTCEQFQEEINSKITCTKSFMDLAQQAIDANDDSQREDLDAQLQKLFSSVNTSNDATMQLYSLKTLEKAKDALEAYREFHKSLFNLNLSIEGYKNYTI